MTKTKKKSKHKFTLKYTKSLKNHKIKKILPSECPISLKPLQPLKDKINKFIICIKRNILNLFYVFYIFIKFTNL